MSRVENYSLFCEDIRWEANGSPMLAGIMSPVFHPVEYPVTFPRIFFVSMFRADAEIEAFSASLAIFKESNGNRVEIGQFGADYQRDDDDAEGLQWVAISHLPLPPIELEEGDSLIATVDCEGQVNSVYLTSGTLISN